MSYQKQNFYEGQVLTHEHLNYIENGLESLSLTGKVESGYPKDTHLITKDDYITGKYLKDGKFSAGAVNYRVAKFYVEYDSNVYFYTKYGITRDDVAFCFLVGYTDDTYTTVDKIYVKSTPRNVIGRTLFLTKGYYAVSWYDKDDANIKDHECLVIAQASQRPYNKKRTKKDYTLNNSDMLLFNNATINENNEVTVGGGKANKAILVGDFMCWHYSLTAKFKCATGSDFSFVMGKDNQRGVGLQVGLVKEGDSSIVNVYTVDEEPTTILTTYTLEKIVFEPEEQYTLKLSFDTMNDEENPQKVLTIEVYDDYNNVEKFEIVAYANGQKWEGFGPPIYYSNSDSCTVYDFTLSVSHYYDPQNLKAVVFGHSFVQANATPIAQRASAFTYMLEKALGKGRVINFGYGGDTAAGVVPRMISAKKIYQDAPYVFLCLGANDTSIAAEKYLADLQEAIKIVESIGATPILFTQCHIDTIMKEPMLIENEWIRSSGYPYVDMYKVYANKDGSCKSELQNADQCHPNVEGHELLFQRIKIDCPFVF